MDDTETQEAVDSILSQLKNLDAAKETQIIPAETPTAENLEKFVIDKASELINKSLNVLDEFQSVLTASPSEESADSMASLITATSSAIETLNKVLSNNKRAQTQLQVKEMDINAKRENNKRDNATRLMMTRSEIMKMMQEASAEAKQVEVEATKVD